MKTTYTKFILLLAATTFIACNEEEAPSLHISASADKTEVKVGEPVTFSIRHNAMAVSIYTGDDGHDYKSSAYYLLLGKTNDDLQNNNYRPIDPEITPYNCNFADTPAGSTSITDNLAEVVNKKLNLRMRFDKDILGDVSSGEQRPDITTFQVVIRLGGIGVGETEVIFRDETVWDIYWNPNTAFTDYSVDLSSVIDAWQGATGKTMGTLSYIQILFTPSNNAGYLGDYYIASASYGDIDYIPFSTGQSLNINDNSGILKYQYTYTQPGNYQVVVIGTNTSMKNYSDSGYKDNVGNNIHASEYDYNTQFSTIDITVRP